MTTAWREMWVFGVLVVLAAGRCAGQEPTASDYLWLNTDPPGASVEVAGQERGETPVFVSQLPPGDHAVQFTKAGYQTMTRTFRVPGPAEMQTIPLRLADGVCLIESDPPAASVIHGTQLLGRTPLVLDSLAPGEYEFRVMRPGYVPGTCTVTVSRDRAAKARVTLAPNTGSILVTTIPAEAKIYVDDAYKGTTSAGEGGLNRSKSLLLGGFTAGPHEVKAEYRGVAAPSKVAQVAAGKTSEMLLMVWYPGTRVTLNGGASAVGMLIEKNKAGDVVLAVTLENHRRILAERIAKIEELSITEVKKVLAGDP